MPRMSPPPELGDSPPFRTSPALIGTPEKSLIFRQGDDPSALTTAQVHREILHLRELLEYRVAGLDRLISQRAKQQNAALRIAQEVTRREANEVQESIGRRVESLIRYVDERVVGLDKLTDAKFVTFRTLIDSQAEKVALALAAADKAVSKAEVSTEKRFEQFNDARMQFAEQTKNHVTRVEFEATADALADKIDDLRKSRDLGSGKATGAQALWGYLVGAVGLAATIIFVILAFNN